jgi:exopolysaccharide biosynthesis polyprenyl glycosylphosphotransferase
MTSPAEPTTAFDDPSPVSPAELEALIAAELGHGLSRGLSRGIEIVDLTGIPDAAERPARLPAPRAEPLPAGEPADQADLADLADLADHEDGTAGRGWARRYVMSLVVLDALALGLAGVIALRLRFGVDGMLTAAMAGTSYLDLVALAVPGWLAVLAARRAYEPRYLGLGSEEFRRVCSATLLFTSLFAIICVAGDYQPARLVVGVALPLASVLTVLLRYLARLRLQRRRLAGSAGHRVLLVGVGPSRAALADRLRHSPRAGLTVVGATGPRLGRDGELTLDHVPYLVARCGADTVAVAHSPGITPGRLRELSWALEGCGIDLLVAPALTDVAGPRIHVRPVSGMPLLQVAMPEFTGGRRLLKASLDRLGGLVALLLAAPLLLTAAAAVRLTSPGPALFRQQRIGLDGKAFTMFKLRSMVADAEARRHEIGNDHDEAHVLFKAAADPRITPVGRLLRRYSLDELPQLINVALGQMSLVGPRPPLPDEVARYSAYVHRRLLVKPGMTGLWQVSGRADLDWQESVRLDLYYVENWSPAMDLEILWKTGFAVLAGAGAR